MQDRVAHEGGFNKKLMNKVTEKRRTEKELPWKGRGG